MIDDYAIYNIIKMDCNPVETFNSEFLRDFYGDELLDKVAKYYYTEKKWKKFHKKMVSKLKKRNELRKRLELLTKEIEKEFKVRNFCNLENILGIY